MPAALLAVLRALVDAAFQAGSITDVQHTSLLAAVDAEDPGIQNAPAAALNDAEQAELERLTAKQAAAAGPVMDAPPYSGGDEGTGFGG